MDEIGRAPLGQRAHPLNFLIATPTYDTSKWKDFWPWEQWQ
jgi:hypothetical protein